MSWLLTYSGKHFDLIDPQPDMIDVVDIVKGLSREARFAGQTRYFYSVAQHCVVASQIVASEFAMEALMHDASEAYIKDIPRPLKQLLPDYRMIEARVQGAICDRFGLPPLQSDAVSAADRIMLATERRDLMPDDATDWPILHGVKPMDKRLNAVNYNHAESLFMQRFLEVLQKS
jgi:uncharacterized protein